jgi:O-acetyl-ADP-ribose deacetylase (regulator of RNase III)
MKLQASWNGCDIYLHQGDITTLTIDVIVNAANPRLAGGGGVDGAIHRRGGPTILEECRRIIAIRGSPLPAGQAVLTGGGRLLAAHVVHTVGPVYSRDSDQAPQLLADAYRNSLAIARGQGLRSIAFPCISTGAYGYPSDEACPVALTAVRADLEHHGGFERVVFCTFEAFDHDIYVEAFRQVTV